MKHLTKHIITSVQNPQVKAWTRLKIHKHRQKSGLFLMEGTRYVCEALLTHQPIEAIIYCDALIRTERARTVIRSAPQDLVWQVSKQVAMKLSERNRPGELFCVCRHIDITLEGLPQRNNPFYVVLDEPHGPGNLGCILRTAEGAGADACIIIEPAVDLYHPAVVRSTVGSLFGFPIVRVPNRQVFLDWYDRTWAKSQSIHCIAATPEAERSYTTLSKVDETVFVIMGNEQRGLAPELRERANSQVCIKMYGRADSLNTASAAAVIICDIVQKRGRGRFDTPQHQRIPQGYKQPRRSAFT